jgi:hypothetical protein
MNGEALVDWEGLATGPTGTLASGIGGALLAQLGIWLHVHKEARARQAVEAAGLAMARLGNEETANERLFRNINERLRLCEQRYEECERLKHELEARVNHLAGAVIRLSAALDIMRSGYAAAGLKEPPLPSLDEWPEGVGD